MGALWRAKFLVVPLLLINTGCGPASNGSSSEPNTAPSGVPREFSVDPGTRLPGAAGLPANRSEPTLALTPVPATSLAAVPDAVEVPLANAGANRNGSGVAPVPPPATPKAVSAEADKVVPAEAASLLEAAQNSTFHQFGDDVYTWDGNRKVVILKVPVDHPALDEVRDLQGHWDGNIENTPESRSWVQRCARRHVEPALSTSDAVYGAVSAQSVYSCLGGLAHLFEIFARYWWTDDGVACVADAVTAHSLQGDARARPLPVCPSVGYDPAAPRPPGWLAHRCAEVVAANPNPRYPTDSVESANPLPSCWEPLIGIVEAHAAESAGIGLPDSPHDCYHAFLGYVWARQTGRESRPPSDSATGCGYRAFEAIR